MSESEKKLARWAEYFCEELNQLEPTNTAQPRDPESILPINFNDFKEEDVWNVIKMLKNNKSPGIDVITTEMLKVGGDEAVQ